MTRRWVLNGWQRLWVVLSLVSLLVVSGVAYTTLPSKESVMYKLLEGEQVPLDLFEEFALRDYLLEEKPIAQSAHEFSKEPNKPIKLDAGKLERLGNRIKALHAQQTTNTFALGLAVWFIVCAAIYAGGWAVGWIAAGFRKHAP